jgi:sulfofructose kinase
MLNPPLLFLGYANVDLIATVPNLPKSGERVTALPIEVLPGGMAANAACTAASLGAEVFFFGNIGKDDYGQRLLEDFQKYKVHTGHLEYVERTTVCLITVTSEGERTIISEPTQYHPESLRCWLEAYQGVEGYLYVDGYHLGVAQVELQLAKAKGFTVYCDFDGALDTYTLETILQALPYVNTLQITDTLLLKLTGLGLRLKDLQTLVSMIITTNGSKEVTVYSPDRQVFQVPEVRVVDTTGAGDTFAGSFLAFYSSTRDLQAAIREAIQKAAMSVGIKGARGFDDVQVSLDPR